MRILVTGLCLSRNLGGPAMALTLVEQLKMRIDGTEFVFAIVPESYEQEKKWANYYGLEIVRRGNIISYLASTYKLIGLAKTVYKFARRRQTHLQANPSKLDSNAINKEFMAACSSCDAVIDMQGTSYVGDGARGPFEGLVSYSSLYFANKYKKPFIRFIQSFGPFYDWKVRFFARRNFNQVDFIPARGKESARHCREIVKDPEKVFDFPDCAILLPTADADWTNDYLAMLGLAIKEYVVLSPSVIIYNLAPDVGGSIGEKHIETFSLIAEKLLSSKNNILFLPHMYSDDKSECDREICRKVLRQLSDINIDTSKCKIVEDDLDVWQSKALISKAKAAVVSRYHALAAAASTGVPVVTIGWNIKYSDLTEYYGIENMAIDVRSATPQQISHKVLEKLVAYNTNKSLVKIMTKRQQENAEKVRQAFDMLAEWLIKKIK